MFEGIETAARRIWARSPNCSGPGNPAADVVSGCDQIHRRVPCIQVPEISNLSHAVISLSAAPTASDESDFCERFA
jgi:hypothetical protein